MRISAIAIVLVALTWLPRCAADEDTESPVEAALEFLAALNAGDLDRAWDRTADEYREPWAKHIEEAGRDPGIRRPVFDHWIPEEIEERLDAGEFGDISPRELFRRVGVKLPLPPSDSSFTTESKGDEAWIMWEKESLAVGLRREGRRWLVTYAHLCVTDIVGTDLYPGIPLPRLPHDRLIETDSGLGPSYVPLRITANGTCALGGKIYSPKTLAFVKDTSTIKSQSAETLEGALAFRAEMYFDSGPARRERVLHLGAHRDAAWSDVEAVLLAATKASYRSVKVITRVRRFKDYGIHLRLAIRAEHQVGSGLPLVEVAGPIRESLLAGLQKAVGVLPEDRRRLGVRVRLAAELRSEDALSALLALSAASAPRLFVEHPPPGVPTRPGVRVGGEIVEDRPGSVLVCGESVLRLVLQ